MCNCSSCSKITTTKGEKGDTGATGAPGENGSSVSENLGGSSANLALTEEMTGGTVYFNRPTGVSVELPTAPADGTYYNFETLQTASGGNYVVTATGGDEITGFIDMKAGGAPDTPFSPVSTDNVITMNGTTTGGVVGTSFRTTYIAETNLWFVSGQMRGSGSIATPFS